MKRPDDLGDDLGDGKDARRGLGRPSDEHQVANHVPDAICLCADTLEGGAADRIGFPLEQLLDAADDRRQRIIDFVAGAGGEFGEGGEFVGIGAQRKNSASLRDSASRLTGHHDEPRRP